jgi:hypothetical protein
MNIALFNGDDFLLIDRDRLIDDQVCAGIDARILLTGRDSMVSAGRGICLDVVRATSFVARMKRKRNPGGMPRIPPLRGSIRATALGALTRPHKP